MLLTLDSCRVDLGAHVVRRSGAEVGLTEYEHALLAYLAARPGQDVSRAALLEAVWGWRARGTTRAVDNTMMRLRAKVEQEPAQPRHLITVRGVGYRFEGPPPSRTDHGLLGADAALGRLLGAIDGGGVVTLIGPGGVGKSTLARAALEQRRGVFCRLEGCQTASDVVGTLASVLGLQQVTREALRERLAGSGDIVVVLDNFEQLEEAATGLLASWREAAPAVTFLVTSRRRLRLEGEVVEELRPLSDEAAAALFLARVGRTKDAATDDERALVRRLDNLPLAIELVAGWSDLGGAAQLSQWLDTCLSQLQARAPRPARHSSLTALLDGSFRLLPPDAARALAQLSVFTGFDLAGAAAVLGPAGVATLGLLRDHSLLQARADAEGVVRFSMLGIIRSAAAAQLSARPALEQAAARAHAEHMARWVQQHQAHKNKHPRRYLAGLLRERADLACALERVAGTDGDLEGWLALGLGEITRHGGDARAELRRLDRVFERVRRPSLRGQLVNARATWLCRLKRGSEAMALLDATSEEVWEGAAEIAAAHDAFRALCRLTGASTDLPQAHAIMTRCVARARESGSDIALAVATSYLGKVCLMGEALDEAQQRLEQAVELLGEVGQVKEQEAARVDLAQLLLRREQHDEAAALLRAVEDAAAATEQWYTVRLARLLLMQVALDEGDLDAAEAAADIGHLPMPIRSAYLLGVLDEQRGDLALMRGDRDEARARWRAASGHYARARRPGLEIVTRARLCLLDGQVVTARPRSADHQDRIHALLTGDVRDQTSFPSRQCARMHRLLQPHAPSMQIGAPS